MSIDQPPARPASGWSLRTAHIAEWIRPGQAVLDLGCGDGALRQHLPAHCTYRGLDRGDVDLNQRALPPLPRADVVVLAGVLEYLDDPPWVLEAVGLTSLARTLLLTYQPAAVRGPSKDRQLAGWRSHLTLLDMLHAAAAAGFGLVDARQWKQQWLGKFRRLA